MKSVEFCYWLQGMFELAKPQTLDADQTKLIQQHLAMVFKHEIDPSYPAHQQVDLNKLHADILGGGGLGKDASGFTGPAICTDGQSHSTGIIYRC